MKSLFIIRHAKSSWDNYNISDFDRPLNARGFRTAPEMADYLKERDLIPDLLVSSTALRAKQTCTIFAEANGIDPTAVLWKPEIYESHTDTITKIVQDLPNEANTVFLFGHNPTLTDFVNMYADSGNIFELPTCGIVRIDAKTETWKNFSMETGQTKAKFFPKEI